ncbi:hypothetical protein pdam_00025900 [Pocillopora damicornis]|uniref:Uncharacterized protein n=1 Tax=Pocillopora damicornis TaxID=46731 RepID=A0A3M6UNK1_POCDA|nr:hypothetical protein pdam_00025900 [Pocillopora damicornis]
MKECENNGATSNDNPENNIALSIATLMINLHISLALRRNRLIEKYFMSKKSGEVTLLLDSKPIPVFCHMGDFGCGNGGWTPIMKINGNKSTFHYDSHFWSNRSAYNLPGGKTSFDLQETKLPTTPFSKICLGMKIDNQHRFIGIDQQADLFTRSSLMGNSSKPH